MATPPECRRCSGSGRGRRPGEVSRQVCRALGLDHRLPAGVREPDQEYLDPVRGLARHSGGDCGGRGCGGGPSVPRGNPRRGFSGHPGNRAARQLGRYQYGHGQGRSRHRELHLAGSLGYLPPIDGSHRRSPCLNDQPEIAALSRVQRTEKETMWTLLVTLAFTLYMTGMIWSMHVFEYPLFASVGAEEFAAYHAAHNRRLPFFVILPSFLALASAIGLVWVHPAGMPGWLLVLVVALDLAVIVSTIVWQAPLHARLDREGYAAEVI